MSADDEWVDVTDADAEASAPELRSTPAPETTSQSESTSLTDPRRLVAFNTFVCDTVKTSPVFTANGLAYVLRYPSSATSDEAKKTARTLVGCNACTSRAGIYCRDVGPAGPVLFSQIAHDQSSLRSLSTDDASAISSLRNLATAACAQATKPELVVVTASTYMPAAEGCSPCGEPFYHWTVYAAEYSTPAAASRYDKLKHYYGQMDSRLAKLTVPEAVASVEIMLEESPGLERPGHYASVLQWVRSVHKAAAEECTTGGGSFEAMSHADQAKVRVIAIMSGRVDGTTHLDFHQADNIVDFCTMPSRDALRAEMDRRSDPRYYMVSQLNRRLAAEGVTSSHLIGLTWDGQYADDLDIHVTTPTGKEIYYGNKSADGCKLDFDANVSSGEANPCENVSVKPGTYKVRVNNYTRRTFGKPIPFQIVCRQEGHEDTVYEGVWSVNRAKGNMVEVCKHTFTVVEGSGPVKMSAKSASRATALNGEWMDRVGEAKATIATLCSLEGVAGVDVVIPTPPSAAAVASRNGKTPASVSDAFMGMALNAKDGNKPKRPFLSQSCKAQPSTVPELIEYMKANPATTLAVHPRDHSPGYLVSIATKTGGVRKSSLPAACHFHDRTSYPVKPVAGTIGNARIDPSWLPSVGAARSSGAGGLVPVEALVTSAEDNCVFLALRGATLPSGGGEAFPLASGFYPTDLCTDLHAHRERWTYCHTQLKPSMPSPARGGDRAKVVPMVGTFLTAETATVYVDGVKMTLKT